MDAADCASTSFGGDKILKTAQRLIYRRKLQLTLVKIEMLSIVVVVDFGQQSL